MNKSTLKETHVSHRIGELQMNIYDLRPYAPCHWHDEYEFVCVTEGTCEIYINAKQYIVNKGQAFLIHGGELHTLSARAGGLFFAVVFHPYTVFGTELQNLFSPKTEFDRIYDSSNSTGAEIVDVLNQILDVYKSRRYGFELMLKAYVTFAIGLIYQNGLYRITARESRWSNAFTSIIDYTNKNYQDKLTIDDVARHASFSCSYISRLFRENTGKSFCDYLNNYRVYKARELLETTDRSVLEIAEECGFDNVSYFIRVFKKAVGVTPRRYRSAKTEAVSV